MSVFADIYRNVDFPVLCTRGIIVFPGQDCSIDVGRDMSINALNLSKEMFDSMLVVITQKDLHREDISVDNMYSFGTLCTIKRMRQDKNVYKVKLHGMARCQINIINIDTDCIKANISAVDDIAGDRNEEKALISRVMSEYTELNKEKNIAGLFPLDQSFGISAAELTDTFAHHMPMELSSREEFLETLNINDRLYMILDQFNISKEINQIDNKIKEKLYKTANERNRETYIRAQIAALKEELNESEGEDSNSLADVFEKNPYPEHVKQKAREEINHLENMPSVSSEASMLQTYIEWLRDVPWYQKTQDRDDIDEISRILDEDHYGLEKVKNRILEYIAVKKLTDSLNAPILCLVGPPGVGKTSLAKSVARALDRKFVKMSLGGVKDEAEIRGHRRTYIGALPGRVIQGMKKAGTINPVFLIDEIDKMGADYKGDPSSALLEVLDPEQNSLFSDHYLEEQYDLSKVLFIATANDLSRIPGPLMDRLEVIEMNSYTEDEKMHIATDHLLKKELAANGLTDKQFKLDNDMILYLIRYYTREAGVRQLERVIGSLCRKVALAITKGERKSVKITKKLVNEYLGKEQYEYGIKENEDQVGVVTGLAYTQFGGDILPIEVTHFPGKGGIIMTGNLGDIMKESASIAVGYIKANAEKYHIDSTFFEKNDIHIHCPEGAVPKDGPSAGVTMTTAIISSITGKKVSSNIAMTGEVTLRGNVLPIGGLREKSMAAYRSNINRIIIPDRNMRDLDEIPQVVKDNMTFIPAKSMDDVIGAALS